MNEIPYILLNFIAGIILGAIFFGGLWLTIKKSVKSKTPWLLFLSSAVIRTVIVLLGFYYTSLGNMPGLLICTLGFIIARQIILRINKTADQTSVVVKKEVSYEA